MSDFSFFELTKSPKTGVYGSKQLARLLLSFVCQVDKCRISVKMMNFRSDYVVFDFQVELKLYFMFSSIRNEVKHLKPYLPY